MPDDLRRLTRGALSLALDTWLWLINFQMLVIGLMGKALRRLSDSEPAPLS